MTRGLAPSLPAPLVVLDVDSTLIEDEVIELFADLAGSRDSVAAITASAMNGEIDFATSLRERVITLRGLDASSIDDVRARVRLTTGAVPLIEGVHAAGGRVGVVSGGFHEVLDPLAADLGLDFHRANRLGVRDGVLTGEVIGPVIDAAGKAEALREWAAASGVDLAHAVAVGDGANDLEMMRIAGLSIAFDAKAPVRTAADVAVDVRDLSQILPLLGLRG
ncbi:phosphoserine phosphatase SerB [Amnibacterium flavum]|uniref:phosphoserine phosphatase n=1 Tax=Amnibacterium flavum TaxID=2173173 RepID=A0A2V1HW40_9MICO|nr:phosphoserine phosphatase SerB [Amnibacterium flavum]PVZ94434.1 phosphoserine phosphatase SerB [Amnibacterium flavum]